MRRRHIKAAFSSILALIAILGAFGCGKKATQVAPQPAPSTTSQTPGPQTAQTPASSQSSQPNSAPDLAPINRTLIRWIISNKRRPASFEDFAATADSPIPPAPAGQKYVIGANMHVQLVSQ